MPSFPAVGTLRNKTPVKQPEHGGHSLNYEDGVDMVPALERLW